MALRIRPSPLDNELWQVNAVIGEHLRAAIDSAMATLGKIRFGTRPIVTE